MDNDALRRPDDSIIEWKFDRVRTDARGRAGRECSAGRLFYRLAITPAHLIEIKPQVLLRLCQIEKEIVEREIVQHQYAGIFHHRFENAGVITMIVSHVVKNRVVRFELS